MTKFIHVGRDRFINADNIRYIKIYSESFYPTNNPYLAQMCVTDDEPYILEVIYLDNEFNYFHLTQKDYDNFIEITNKGE
jgi:hypothetical protein